ncbi:type II toxin-antitoxin system HipA family toxin [Castellaniella caeni]
MAISIHQLKNACREIEVFVEQTPVGTLTKSGDHFAFTYRKGIDPSLAVSLLMPVRVESYRTRRPGVLLPAFDMNLPEGEHRRVLTARYSKLVVDFNDLALLFLVGRTTIGRVTFGAPQTDKAGTLELDALMSSRSAEELLNALYRSDAAFSAISGMQPKVLARLNEADVQKFSDDRAPGQNLRLTLRTDDIVVKASPSDKPWLAANEFYCLRAAKLAGLVVPETRLFRDGQVLLVERFDRAETSTNGLSGLASEDFCSLNAFTSSYKYTSSYERVVSTLKRWIVPEASDEQMRRLFKSIALSCAVRNGDAHLKNFTLLYCPQEGAALEPRVIRATLSPTYDVCTTNAYLSEDMLALDLLGSKKYPARQKLTDFGVRICNLPLKTIEAALAEVSCGVRRALDELRLYAENNPRFMGTVGQPMIKCWQAGLASIDTGRSGSLPSRG